MNSARETNPKRIRLDLITALQSSGLRSTKDYVNKKLRCRCNVAARWLARQARGNDRLNSHSPETPEASQRAKVLRHSQLANIQVFDEDDVKVEQTVRKRETADLRRDGSADSPGGVVEDIDFLNDYFEALLSCPHAIPKFLSETQMPAMQFSALTLKRPVAIALRVIAAADCIHFLCFSRANCAN
jgi:hypothetical protein